MKNGKLKLSHTILYAKGWYDKGDEVWSDLVKTLSYDNYTISDNKHDVAMFLRKYISNNHEILKKHSLNCLTIDYFCNEVENIKRRYDMDNDDATITVCLGILYALDSEAWVLVEPNPFVLKTDSDRIEHMSYLIDQVNIN